VTGPPTRPGRLPLVADDGGDDEDPRLAAVFDVFRKAGRGVPTLYRTLGNAPAMLQAWTGLAWPLRHDATTPRGLRELIIMRVAQLTGAPYEWLAHWDMAVRSGVTEDQLAELGRWLGSDRFGEPEREVLAMVDELTVDVAVGDDTWARLAARHEAGELVELVLTTGYYACVSRVLQALRIEPDVADDDPRLVAFTAG